ncbi:MAG: hypothetical protein AAF617_09020 [Bacteroidota bacterium]
MTTELIIIIIIVAVLAPLLFMNTRKNKRRANSRKSREFMSDYLDKKKDKNDAT